MEIKKAGNNRSLSKYIDDYLTKGKNHIYWNLSRSKLKLWKDFKWDTYVNSDQKKYKIGSPIAKKLFSPFSSFSKNFDGHPPLLERKRVSTSGVIDLYQSAGWFCFCFYFYFVCKQV